MLAAGDDRAVTLTELVRADYGDLEIWITENGAAFDDERWSGLPPIAREKTMIRLAELLEELGHLLELGFEAFFVDAEVMSIVLTSWPARVTS